MRFFLAFYLVISLLFHHYTYTLRRRQSRARALARLALYRHRTGAALLSHQGLLCKFIGL